MPNEHYGFDIGYAYSDVYTATNICFLGTASSTASTTIPGAATPSGIACPSPPPRGGSGPYTFGPAKDFMNAPTQYASVALASFADRQVPRQHRLPNKLGHAPLFQRSARCQRIAGLYLPVAFL